MMVVFFSTSRTNPVYRTSTSESQRQKMLISIFLLSKCSRGKPIPLETSETRVELPPTFSPTEYVLVTLSSTRFVLVPLSLFSSY